MMRWQAIWRWNDSIVSSNFDGRRGILDQRPASRPRVVQTTVGPRERFRNCRDRTIPLAGKHVATLEIVYDCRSTSVLSCRSRLAETVVALKNSPSNRTNPLTGHLGLRSSNFWKSQNFPVNIKARKSSIRSIIMSNDTISFENNENEFKKLL